MSELPSIPTAQVLKVLKEFFILVVCIVLYVKNESTEKEKKEADEKHQARYDNLQLKYDHAVASEAGAKVEAKYARHGVNIGEGEDDYGVRSSSFDDSSRTE